MRKGNIMREVETKYRNDFCVRCGELSCTLNFNEALNTILDNVDQCLDVEASSIHILDAASQSMTVVAARNLSKEYTDQGPIPLEKSPVEQEALKGKTMVIRDVKENAAYQELAEREGIRSVLCAPLKSKDRVIGTLWLYTRTVREFTETEISYITTLSSQGGVVLGNAKLYQGLHAMSEIGRAITSRLDQQEVLQMIVERSTELIGGKGASIFLLSRHESIMEVSATHGLSERFLKKGPVHIAKSIRECLDHLVVISDVARSKEVEYPEDLKTEGIRSILCGPLKVRQQSIGELRVYLAHTREYSAEDRELFQILCDFGAIAIENARLFDHIRRDYEDLTQDVWQWYNWGERSPRI